MPMDPTILERAAVLAAARRLLGGVTEGRGGSLFVAGEPGLGKTTVLNRVIVEAGDHFRVGVGRGDVAEALLPFGLIGQALDQLLGTANVLDPPADARPGASAGSVRMPCLATFAGRPPSRCCWHLTMPAGPIRTRSSCCGCCAAGSGRCPSPSSPPCAHGQRTRYGLRMSWPPWNWPRLSGSGRSAPGQRSRWHSAAPAGPRCPRTSARWSGCATETRCSSRPSQRA